MSQNFKSKNNNKLKTFNLTSKYKIIQYFWLKWHGDEKWVVLYNNKRVRCYLNSMSLNNNT